MCTIKCVSVHFSICTFDCFSFHFMQAARCHGNYDIYDTVWFYPSFSKKKKKKKKTLYCEWSVVPLQLWVICLSAPRGWAALIMLFPHTVDFKGLLQKRVQKFAVYLTLYFTYSREIPSLLIAWHILTVHFTIIPPLKHFKWMGLSWWTCYIKSWGKIRGDIIFTFPKCLRNRNSFSFWKIWLFFCQRFNDKINATLVSAPCTVNMELLSPTG